MRTAEVLAHHYVTASNSPRPPESATLAEQAARAAFDCLTLAGERALASTFRPPNGSTPCAGLSAADGAKAPTAS